MWYIIPDVHGRDNWKEQLHSFNPEVDSVIFLGDYFDPYDFENISVADAIENFKKILEFKKNNFNKVILLLGNHDMPYVFNEYYDLSNWHCRHSKKYHNEIHNLFNHNISFFKIAHVEDNILFTHAGVESGWLENVVKCDNSDINEICDKLKRLTDYLANENGIYYYVGKKKEN